MTARISLVLFFICVMFSENSFSQSDSLLTKWAEFAEEDPEFIEIIEHLYENPININTADKEDFLRIPFITPALADSIISIRNIKGSFKSKRQLSPLLGYDLYLLTKDFFITKSPPKKIGCIIHKNYISIEKSDEIVNGKYKGDAVYDYNKLYFNYSENLKAGMITQKDVGEKSYVDYLNGFIEYNYSRGRVILGNYYLKFGQGLTFSNPFSSQKSSMVTLPFRTINSGGFSSLSSSENSGQFGLYAKVNNIFTLNCHIFYAYNLRDAQLSSLNNHVIGMNYDGYHRTDSEIQKKDLVEEQIFGASAIREIGNQLRIGFLYSNFTYSPALDFNLQTVDESSLRRQYFKFAGSRLNQFSLFYNLQHRKISIAGEAAVSDYGTPAFSQSIFLNLNRVKFGLKYWRVSKDFQSPCGRIFDNSNPFPQAEQGVYAGLFLLPVKNLTVKGYKLIKKDLWRAYFDRLPVLKDEWLLQGDYKFKPHLLTARIRKKRNEEFITLDNGREICRLKNQTIIRLQVEFNPTKKIRFKSRWESTGLNINHEKGTYIFQDIRYKFTPQISLNSRITFFRTDSYDSRLYEYENDLPGSFSNYALYGQGHKWYFLIKWTAVRQITVWLKLRYAYIEDQDLSDHNFKNSTASLNRQIRFQFQVKL